MLLNPQTYNKIYVKPIENKMAADLEQGNDNKWPQSKKKINEQFTRDAEAIKTM